MTKQLSRELAWVALVAVGLLSASTGEAVVQSISPSTHGPLAQVGQLVTPQVAGVAEAGNSLSNIVVSGAIVFEGAPFATITTQLPRVRCSCTQSRSADGTPGLTNEQIEGGHHYGFEP